MPEFDQPTATPRAKRGMAFSLVARASIVVTLIVIIAVALSLSLAIFCRKNSYSPPCSAC